jgi:hypothetical protein
MASFREAAGAVRKRKTRTLALASIPARIDHLSAGRTSFEPRENPRSTPDLVARHARKNRNGHPS